LSRRLSTVRIAFLLDDFGDSLNTEKADGLSNHSGKGGVTQMAKEPRHIDISSIPELQKLVHEVRQTNEPAILQQEREDVAKLTPLKSAAKKRGRSKPTSADDPLWRLVGIGHSGKGDVSENKHTYLAEAYMPRKQV
jgi:hypothetical protein